MKYTKIDAPLTSIQHVKINGELVVIPSTYDGIRICGDYDRLTVYLCSFEHDTEWAFAAVELDDTETIDGGIRTEHDIYDGYDIDVVIESALEQCKID